ncbi:MAG TPA: ferredoxin [Polyangiaceae bacterium]|jgi:sterol 14-demethylase|nr:ferredoxin [Polyangiaceae bacterium]
MGLRVIVDRQLCQGHGVCMSEAPEVFEVGRDGKLKLLNERPPEALREQLDEAVKYCPTGALSIVEER